MTARLSSTGPGPNPVTAHGGLPQPFALCPELSHSFISEHLAQSFGLNIRELAIPQLFPLRQVALFSQKQAQVASTHIASATIQIECYSGITPVPLQNMQYDFIVLCGDKFLPNTAIMGRNIINHMLVLYRGLYRVNHVVAAPDIGHVYFGQDTGL
jgi:hypothetical protein